jgi:hypothetical protein
MFLELMSAGLRRGMNLMRFVCVLSVAMASVTHVALDVRAAHAAGTAIVTCDDATTKGDDATAAERCHDCSVVQCIVMDGASVVDLFDADIPEGRLDRLESFRQPATGPPPRT